MTIRSAGVVFGALLGALLLGACTVGEPAYLDVIGERGDIAPITQRGSDQSLDIATWNIEWFGSTSNGPRDEGRQLDRVRDVILGSDIDIWGVEEITASEAFDELVANLPGYSGILASDPQVESGSDFYHGSEQKVGVIFKQDLVEVVRARVVLTGSDYDFAGRPPLEVTMNVTVNGQTDELIMLVMHAKARTDSSSYNRRLRASEALHEYFDAQYPDSHIVLVGDINDDVDESIRNGYDSPYANFVDDPAYTFPTGALSDAGRSSTTRYYDVIDHHLVSDDLLALYIADSADVLDSLEDEISDYDGTTSDHYPVMTRFQWGSDDPPPPPPPPGDALVLINEVLANEPGSDTTREFVEIVNIGDAPVDLSGWTLADNNSERHAFTQDTVLAPRTAIVVFGGAAGIPAGLASAEPASSGSLSLSNGGDSVFLHDAGGALVDEVAYSSALAVDGVSMNRAIDGDITSEFVRHDELGAETSSPGTRADGSPFEQ